MASNSKTLRSPLQVARGLGSAKHGTEHWWSQRLTAIALVPLTVWFVFGVIGHLGADHAAFVAWMKSPFSAVMMVLTAVVTFHHAQSGLQVVIEDYVHVEWQKMALIIGVKFLSFALAAACVLAVVKIFIGA
ncbi:succinate dehydrogenase, hydrophobic membrane anchor protein [Azospirillum sp. INR13]|uniref:Succinate dehydrogenase hydrophobic membrane anchor subunit n=1 Tax=Azospirillum ramasamyi TaxID=682998 RepID=A0A2U9SAG3_9PROT|nr:MULTISPECIES: succinate dehydrogenase, hydrophobic membrane anchor protein [Azospirillum]AWU94709.1 succinate dehydrogenase, hydrophobic membrane anchor protein [Azospirillum ramasamyi]KAA0580435.1 succinate dehydrogenase, hydrophobic membrane anchor protein [Azospirillum sp. B21]MBF5093330.1 succinate dehydrogenase, hydrophobic membrane anchor protein [Azospirillum sp. INR13]MDR6769583.1 succinate dehydrogenase / fumarate reductase membrane anchor subunit [Azospirillum sp. BE72]